MKTPLNAYTCLGFLLNRVIQSGQQKAIQQQFHQTHPRKEDQPV